MEVPKLDIEPLLDAEQVGALLGRTPRQIRALHSSGALAAVRFPGSTALRFRPETLRRFAIEHESRKAA